MEKDVYKKLLLLIPVAAAGAVDRELLYIEWENFFPPTATTATTTTNRRFRCFALGNEGGQPGARPCFVCNKGALPSFVAGPCLGSFWVRGDARLTTCGRRRTVSDLRAGNALPSFARPAAMRKLKPVCDKGHCCGRYLGGSHHLLACRLRRLGLRASLLHHKHSGGMLLWQKHQISFLFFLLSFFSFFLSFLSSFLSFFVSFFRYFFFSLFFHLFNYFFIYLFFFFLHFFTYLF